MCGIFGLWAGAGEALDLAAVERGTTALRHRGPDDVGYLLVQTATGRMVHCGGPETPPALGLPGLAAYADGAFDLALGFRRLAILDLSPAGHQPMRDPTGQHWLIFNGEIYNYKALRAELAGRYEFRSGSDSEVILAAYAAWGPDCVRRFNGMWAFALWDQAARRLVLSRDRFGIKPLYFVAPPTGRVFAFASEIKALLAAGAVGFHPSAEAVARYLAQGGLPSASQGQTFFRGVRALPAAHTALITPEGVTTTRYWTLPTGAAPARSQDQAVAEYRDLFTDAVRLHLQADVPVGTCLSGGLDSSSLVAVAGGLMHTEHGVALERLGEQQLTFSAVYAGDGPWDERPYIEQVAAHTGAAAHYVVPTVERLWFDLPRLVWHQDEPFGSTSIFAQWCVMDLARQGGVTVLLDGQGADEVLGGYRPFAIWIGQMLRAGQVGRALGAARAIQARTGLNPLTVLARAGIQAGPATLQQRGRRARLQAAATAAALHPDLAGRLGADAGPITAQIAAGATLTDHLARLVVEDSLPTLLRYEDRNSMAFSLEARVPFLDVRLVEYAFGPGASWRLHDGWTKWVQRAAVAERLPAAIVWRRDKVGFETPERAWLAASERHLLALFAHDGGLGDYVDLAQVRAAVPRLLAMGQQALVWRWANVALWLAAFAGAEGASPVRPIPAVRVAEAVSVSGSALPAKKKSKR